jgi:hypothetical protein
MNSLAHESRVRLRRAFHFMALVICQSCTPVSYLLCMYNAFLHPIPPKHVLFASRCDHSVPWHSYYVSNLSRARQSRGECGRMCLGDHSLSNGTLYDIFVFSYYNCAHQIMEWYARMPPSREFCIHTTWRSRVIMKSMGNWRKARKTRNQAAVGTSYHDKQEPGGVCFYVYKSKSKRRVTDRRGPRTLSNTT